MTACRAVHSACGVQGSVCVCVYSKRWGLLFVSVCDWPDYGKQTLALLPEGAETVASSWKIFLLCQLLSHDARGEVRPWLTARSRGKESDEEELCSAGVMWLINSQYYLCCNTVVGTCMWTSVYCLQCWQTEQNIHQILHLNYHVWMGYSPTNYYGKLNSLVFMCPRALMFLPFNANFSLTTGEEQCKRYTSACKGNKLQSGTKPAEGRPAGKVRKHH